MLRARALTLLMAAAATGAASLGFVATSSTASGAPAAHAKAHHKKKPQPKPVVVLKTHSTPLGKVAAGKTGHTAYVFDLDHKGATKSACTGACAQAWPKITFKGTAKTKLKASGVEGKLGSIAAGKGTRQVTLGGRPLYYYVGDGKAGQVAGQGIGGIWWAVSAKGTKITKQPSSAPTTSAPTTAPPTTAPPTTAPPTPSSNLGTATSGLGTVVVDGRGMTVYSYDPDTSAATASTCTGACAEAWPPVVVTGTPTVTGVTGTVGTLATGQVTLDGWPLYTYAGDSTGTTNGQGVGGIWWAMAPDGSQIGAAPTGGSAYRAAVSQAKAKTVTVLKAHASSLGKIVTGSNGRTAYIYTVDTRGSGHSTCTGACLQAWPKITFKGTAKTKIKAVGVQGKLSSIAAGKGKRQVTLNGWPLYYYVGDAAAGQANGQGSGGIWWVLNTKGNPIE